MDGHTTPRAPRSRHGRRATLGALAVALAMASGHAAGATAPLGGPDAPPSAPPAVSLPAPAAPAPAAPLVPAVPDAPAAAAATRSTAPAAAGARRSTGTASADRLAAERARAAAAARRAAARARTRAVTRIGDGVDRRLDTASTILARWASTSARSVERAGGSTGGGLVPSAVLALLLLFVSGLTAGVALLPRHRGDSATAAARPAAAAFVERHRLELAGVATSCLLVAMLVFVGL